MRNCCGGLKGDGRIPENNNCISKYPTYSSQPSYQQFPSLISIPKADIKLWKMFKMWHPFGNFPGSCTNMFLKTACRSFIWISCTFFPWLFFFFVLKSSLDFNRCRTKFPLNPTLELANLHNRRGLLTTAFASVFTHEGHLDPSEASFGDWFPFANQEYIPELHSL